jgi:hypothetical protein
MATLAIDVNDTRVATISLTGMQLVDVSVRGALDCKSKATISAMGSSHGENGSGHLIWIEAHALLAGDIVRIGLNDTHDPGDRGKTIEELHPDEAPSTRTDFSISADMAADLRARPRLHEAFFVRAETSCGKKAGATSDERNTDFVLRILWTDAQPNQVRLALHTHCLDDVLARTGGQRHLDTLLSSGDSATFQLVQ